MGQIFKYSLLVKIKSANFFKNNFEKVRLFSGIIFY